MRIYVNIKERHPQSALRAYVEHGGTDHSEIVMRALDMDGGECNITMTAEQAIFASKMLESEVARMGLAEIDS